MSTLFKDESGNFTSDPSARHRVSPAEIARAWTQASTISPRWAVATAKHETSYTVNERSAGDQKDGSASDGLFQIGPAAKLRSGHPFADLFTLEGSIAALAGLGKTYQKKILDAAAKHGGTYDPRDVLAYLTVAHNQGPEAAAKSIERYGLNWARYVRDNGNVVHPGFNGPRIVAYGNDAITGGPDYDPAWDDLRPTFAAKVATVTPPWVLPTVATIGIGAVAALALHELAVYLGSRR